MTLVARAGRPAEKRVAWRRPWRWWGPQAGLFPAQVRAESSACRLRFHTIQARAGAVTVEFARRAAATLRTGSDSRFQIVRWHTQHIPSLSSNTQDCYSRRCHIPSSHCPILSPFLAAVGACHLALPQASLVILRWHRPIGPRSQPRQLSPNFPLSVEEKLGIPRIRCASNATIRNRQTPSQAKSCLASFPSFLRFFFRSFFPLSSPSSFSPPSSPLSFPSEHLINCLGSRPWLPSSPRHRYGRPHASPRSPPSPVRPLLRCGGCTPGGHDYQ